MPPEHIIDLIEQFHFANSPSVSYGFCTTMVLGKDIYFSHWLTIGRIGFIVNGLIYLLIGSMPFTMQVWRRLKWVYGCST